MAANEIKENWKMLLTNAIISFVLIFSGWIYQSNANDSIELKTKVDAAVQKNEFAEFKKEYKEFCEHAEKNQEKFVTKDQLELILNAIKETNASTDKRLTTIETDIKELLKRVK